MKMISRRDFLKASAVVGATAAMTACGGSSSTSTAASSVASSTAASAAATNGSANVGVCIYQFADNFMTLYRSDLEEYLKDMGYSVTIMDGKNDQNTQTEQINTFLQQGVDVLVINPVQTTSAQTIVDTIKPSETPIVFINREPDKSVLDSYADKCCYVGADARQSGTYQGELILETETQGDINGDGKITYIMCKGDPENIDAQYRTEYSIKALTDAGKEVEKGTTISYKVSSGPDTTSVPDLTDMTEAQARNALDMAGFGVNVSYQENDSVTEGTVISWNPSGKQKPGATITVVIAKKSGKASVPGNLYGKSISAAVTALNNAGFYNIAYCDQNGNPVSGNENATVTGVSPTGKQSTDSTITLTVSLSGSASSDDSDTTTN